MSDIIIHIPPELAADATLSVEDLLSPKNPRPKPPTLEELEDGDSDWRGLEEWKVLPHSVREDLVEACREALELADGEGLSAPYDEDAYGLASYVASVAIRESSR